MGMCGMPVLSTDVVALSNLSSLYQIFATHQNLYERNLTVMFITKSAVIAVCIQKKLKICSLWASISC